MQGSFLIGVKVMLEVFHGVSKPWENTVTITAALLS